MKILRLIPSKDLFNEYRLMYLTLCYLSFYIAYCSFWPISLTEKYFAISATVIFLLCFLNVFHTKKSYRWIHVIPVFIIGVIGATYNFWGGIFLLYSAIMLGLVVQKHILLTMYSIMITIVAVELIILDYHWVSILLILLEITLFTVVSKYRAGSNLDYFKLKQQHKNFKYMATLVERERISRDLHDLIGHSLSMIVMKSELAIRLRSSAPDKCQSELLDITAIADKAKSDVNSAILGYRSKGLIFEINNGEEMLKSSGITTSMRIDKLSFNSKLETALSLIFKEIVTNIIRHSKASHVSISLFNEGSDLVLIVKDNGVGIGDNEGSGIIGIKHRVTECNGSFLIINNAGALLKIRVPYQ